MGQLDDAFKDAADEVAQIKAQPSNRYWWIYGTIKAKNANGTLDVAIDGVTIQQVKATVSCMMANVGDRAIVLKAGPLMTCVDVIATSDNAVVPVASLPTASSTSKGIMQAGSGLTVSDGLVSVDNAAYVRSVDGWTVITVGTLCVCSRTWSYADDATVGTAWGTTLLQTAGAIVLPDYPMEFSSLPASFVEYVRAQPWKTFSAFVERDIGTISTKSPGSVFLVRPDGDHVTIGGPTFAITAIGQIAP